MNTIRTIESSWNLTRGPLSRQSAIHRPGVFRFDDRFESGSGNGVALLTPAPPRVSRFNFPQKWAISLNLLYPDRTYINGLHNFLQAQGVSTILDAAGGTGFPSIALKQLGWDVTYSDGSSDMIDFFQNALKRHGNPDIPTYQSEWDELDVNVPGQFDAVLCRGNSIPYAASDPSNSTEAESKIENALGAFNQALNPGGLLYIDLFRREEFRRTPLVRTFEERSVDGKKVNLAWEITHHPEQKVRELRRILDIDGAVDSQVTRAYLLSHETLIQSLTNAGFSSIQEVAIPGESNYDVFIARKGTRS